MSGNFIRSGVLITTVLVLIASCSSTTSTTSQTAANTPSSVAAPTISNPSSLPAPTSNNTTGGSTITLTVVPEKSKAGYRVTEQLAGVALPSDAVGTTSAISGSIVGKMDGTIVSAGSKFIVDLRTLKSDQAMRDGFIQREPLQTSQYPNATFVPTSVSGLPKTFPPTGTASFKLTGDLTVRNVTKPITWDVTCQPTSQTEGTCNATTSFTFEDFQLNQPRIGRVLSIQDKITLEVAVDLQVAQQ